MPSKVILMGIAARAKMSLSRAQNIFMPANKNSIVILLRATLKAGIWKPESGIQNLESGIWNPDTGIENDDRKIHFSNV